MKPAGTERTSLTRRRLAAGLTAVLAFGLSAPALAEGIRNRIARFRQTFPTQPDPAYAEEMVARTLRGRTPEAELLKVDLTGRAEDGESVPLVFDVDCAMAGNDYPVVVHVFVIDNPFPEVARYYFGPWNGSARTEMRMRMRQSSDVVLVAEMADGRVGLSRQPVEVLAGACS